MSVMPSEKELEHNVALLKKLLELEHNRLMSERERADKWQADAEHKAEIIESLKQPAEEIQNVDTDWQLIKEHFNELIEEEGIPHKHVKAAGKKRIRREANDRAKIEDSNIRKYSDAELGRELKFPQKSMSRRFARQHRKK